MSLEANITLILCTFQYFFYTFNVANNRVPKDAELSGAAFGSPS